MSKVSLIPDPGGRTEPYTVADWVVHVCAMAEAAKQEELAAFEKAFPKGKNEKPEDAEFRRVQGVVKGWTSGQRMCTSPAEAFLGAMPPLTNRLNTKAFIACLAAGLQRKYISAAEVKSLMYTAQLALMAHRPRGKRSTPPPPRFPEAA